MRVLSIIWGSFLASLGVYAVVLAVVAPARGAIDGGLVALLRPVFWVLAVGGGAASIWWRRRVVAQLAELRVAEAAAIPAGAAGMSATRANLLRINCVIVWGLNEAVGIFGVLLGLIAGDLAEFVPFAVAAAALLYLHRPAVWGGGTG